MPSISKDGQQASLPGKIAITRDPKTSEITVEMTQRSPQADGGAGPLEWVKLDNSDPRAIVPIAAFERTLEAVNEFPVLRDYRHTTIANWAANLSFDSLNEQTPGASVSKAMRAATHYASLSPEIAFRVLSSRGLEEGHPYQAKAEFMLANAERYSVTQGAVAALKAIRHCASPAGNMFDFEQQLSAIAKQHPCLVSVVPGFRMMPDQVDESLARIAGPAGFLNHSTSAMQQASDKLAQWSAAYDADIQELRLHTCLAVHGALDNLSGGRSYEHAGLSFNKADDGTTTVTVEAELRPSIVAKLSAAEREQFGTKGIAVVAVMKGAFNRNDLLKELRNTVADQQIRIANSLHSLVDKLTVPAGHKVIMPDIGSDVRFNRITNARHMSVSIRPDDNSRKDPGAVRSELRIFLDRPRASLWVENGGIYLGDKKSIIDHELRHPSASTYEELFEKIADAFNLSAPKAQLELVQSLEAVDQAEDEMSYLVSVDFSKYTADEIKQAECGEYGSHTEPVLMDKHMVSSLIRNLGIHEAQEVIGGAEPQIQFSSTAPTENTEYFEQGIHTYYQLKLHSISGKQVNAEALRGFAEEFGLKYDLRESAGFESRASSTSSLRAG